MMSRKYSILCSKKRCLPSVDHLCWEAIVYAVLMANTIGILSADANGIVLEQPVSQYKLAKHGKTTSLGCTVAEGENVQFSWLKDGSIINSSARITILSDETGSRLAIRKAESADSGNYTCIARNRAAAARLTVHLVVEGKLLTNCLRKPHSVFSNRFYHILGASMKKKKKKTSSLDFFEEVGRITLFVTN